MLTSTSKHLYNKNQNMKKEFLALARHQRIYNWHFDFTDKMTNTWNSNDKINDNLSSLILQDPVLEKSAQNNPKNTVTMKKELA